MPASLLQEPYGDGSPFPSRSRTRADDLGMLPLPGYTRVERMDSMGLNVIGGVIPPGHLDRIAALRYIVRIELAR